MARCKSYKAQNMQNLYHFLKSAKDRTKLFVCKMNSTPDES